MHVGLSRGKLEAEHRHERRAGVGKVIERVRDDRDRTGKESRKKFDGKKKEIERDTEHTAEHAVFLSSLFLGERIGIFDEYL